MLFGMQPKCSLKIIFANVQGKYFSPNDFEYETKNKKK